MTKAGSCKTNKGPSEYVWVKSRNESVVNQAL